MFFSRAIAASDVGKWWMLISEAVGNVRQSDGRLVDVHSELPCSAEFAPALGGALAGSHSGPT